jgi:hypothetical protein
MTTDGKLKLLQNKVAGGVPDIVWQSFNSYMDARTQVMFDKAGKNADAGGTARTVEWDGLKIRTLKQIERETLYAKKYGLYQKVQPGGRFSLGSGKFGKRKESAFNWGNLVRPRVRRAPPRIMQRTGLLRQAGSFFSTWNKYEWNMANPLDYAGYQQSMRPFLFFEIGVDDKKLGSLFTINLEREVNDGL